MRIVSEETGDAELKVLVHRRGERDVIEGLHTCWDGAVGARGRYIPRRELRRRRGSSLSPFGESRRRLRNGHREPVSTT